jgi:hypothetical protein
MAIDKGRYPKHWKRIRVMIRARAGDRCEVCDIANGALIPKRNPPPLQDLLGEIIDVRERNLFGEVVIPRKKRVVLSVAHLDHTPENCDPANLKAMCQRCHLAYDAKYHQQESLKTNAEKRRASADARQQSWLKL